MSTPDNGEIAFQVRQPNIRPAGFCRAGLKAADEINPQHTGGL